VYPSVLNREAANISMCISHRILNTIIVYANYRSLPLAEARHPAEKEILYCFLKFFIGLKSCRVLLKSLKRASLAIRSFDSSSSAKIKENNDPRLEDSELRNWFRIDLRPKLRS